MSPQKKSDRCAPAVCVCVCVNIRIFSKEEPLHHFVAGDPGPSSRGGKGPPHLCAESMVDPDPWAPAGMGRGGCAGVK